MKHRKEMNEMVCWEHRNIYILYLMQVAAYPLDVADLCNKISNPKTYGISIDAYTKVTSSLAHVLSHEISGEYFWQSLDHISLQEKGLYQNETKKENQAEQHCKAFYGKQVAKVTIEFIDTDVMQIKMDTRLTFMDQVGIIGNEIQVQIL